MLTVFWFCQSNENKVSFSIDFFIKKIYEKVNIFARK
jgi:hypothetical protein